LILIAFLVAAQITAIAETAEPRGQLAMEVDATYSHVRWDTKITRERSTAGGILLGDELQHQRTLDAVELRFAAAVWRHLEVHLIAPYALRDVQEWYGLAGGTLATNTIDVSGCAAPGSCTAPQPIGVVPGQSTRSGFFDPTVGIAWSPIRETFDPARVGTPPPVATWVIGLDYTIPIGGKVDDPSRALATDSRPEEKQAHVLTAWMAFSKRIQKVEPYLKVEAAAPFASSQAYDNCKHPETLADVAAANCAGAWKGQTGYKPPFEAALTGGTEIVAYEDRALDRRFSVDLRGGVRWHGPSRGYTQVTDLLGKLTYADEYLTGTAQLALYGRISRWLNLRVTGLIGMDSAHFITHEDIGEDKNGDGSITISQGSGAAAPDQNPNYDFRLDQPGRRLRAEPSLFWGVSGTLAVSF
jgi:hypothetical protein